MKDINFDWRIKHLSTVKDGDRGDVVTHARFQVRATTRVSMPPHLEAPPDSPWVDTEVEALAFGVVQFPEPGDDFTPYPELTEEQVSQWIRASLGETVVNQIVSDLTKELAHKSTPPAPVEPSLPWQR